jgi:hypothetical protein
LAQRVAKALRTLPLKVVIALQVNHSGVEHALAQARERWLHRVISFVLRAT